MFTAALCKMAPNWKQPRCPSTANGLNKLCYIHTKEFYSALKKEWTTDTCKTLAEGPQNYADSQFPNVTYCINPFI